MNNQDVRKAIQEAGLKQWQVSEVYGLHEGNFSRLLRKELPIDKKEKIFSIVDQLKGDK
ncbi:hypothetical protein [Pseudalkalibacillus decolorationis]|uniref:hypothetical protein n=1 Tax=Pseudalkalibacillus decolorationis TaxID=163879 RepID=UPI00214926E1|nr:hypothetical protein [Pseudalkalibacillus decolorationis]